MTAFPHLHVRRKRNRNRKWGIRVPLIVIVATLLAIGADVGIAVFAQSGTFVQIDPEYYQRIIGQEKVIALTFDDGPNAKVTPEILAVLKSENVPATFFMLGENVVQHPDIVRDVARAGHEIGNHTLTHSPAVHDSKERLKVELNTTKKLVETITGRTTVLYRPPYLLDIGGDISSSPDIPDSPLRWANELGYIPIGADIDPRDWEAASVNQIFENFQAIRQPNHHIVLLHDGPPATYTPEGTRLIIRELKSQGYRFVTVSELLGLNQVQEMSVTQHLIIGQTDEQANGQVSALQKFLLLEGYSDRQPTGEFDETTMWELVAWQQERGITKDSGVVGQATRALIQERLSMVQPPKEHVHTWSSLFSWTSAVPSLSIDATSEVRTFLPYLLGTVFGLIVIRLLLVLGLRFIPTRKERVAMPWSGPVSVVIPAYNEESNIAGTLESVLQNDYPDFEVIVVDDGSKDRTAAIVQDYVQANPDRVRLLSVINGGKAQALNHGIRAARSEIIVCMDGDTIFTPQTICHLVQPFSDPAVGAVAGKVCVTKARTLLNTFQHLEYVIAQNLDKKALARINAVNVVPGPVGAWRKELVLALGGYTNDTMVEDQDLSLAVLNAGYRIPYESQAIAYSETPFRMRDFVKQRFRWIFGTLQCIWKYRRSWFSFRQPNFGWGVMAHGLVYGLILPLLYPVLDLLLVLGFVFTFSTQVLISLMIISSIDLMYAILGFHGERQNRKAFLWLPFQRLFYRGVLWFVVSLAVMKTIEGTEAQWNKVRKRGDALAHLISFLPPSRQRIITS